MPEPAAPLSVQQRRDGAPSALPQGGPAVRRTVYGRRVTGEWRMEPTHSDVVLPFARGHCCEA
jgi:hypothetical protein